MSTYARSRGASLERYLRHWRERGSLMQLSQGKDVPRPMTIALSRERGVGASSVAQAIASKLDWPVYDRELVERISEETGVRTELLDAIDEKSPHWLSECLESFQQDRKLSGSGFAIRLLKILFAISGHGNCVIVGRGAAQVMPQKTTLRVRLIAPLEDRIARIQSLTDMSHSQAKKQIAKVDKERNEFVKSYFHKDAETPQGYDLLINPLRFGAEPTADIIVLAQRKRAEILAE